MFDGASKMPTESCQFDAMTVGDICVDLILTGNVRPQFHQVEQIVDDCTLELGGSATIFASQLGKLGASVGVIGSVGDDGFGRFVMERLQAAHVYTRHIRQHPLLKTGVGIALSEKNDRAILTYMGTIDATLPQDLDETVLRSCRHWHIASYFLLNALRNTWPEWLRACKKLGVTTSLDTNWDPKNEWHGVTDLLPSVDVFLPNGAEACAITGEADVVRAAMVLASYGPLVVVKLGEKGALAVKRNDTWELRPSPGTRLPDSIVDATGAGDNFDAGFLRSYLHGKPVYDCLVSGHRCAISSLKHSGGVRGQVWYSELGTLPLKTFHNRTL